MTTPNKATTDERSLTMPDRVRVSEGQMRLILFAVEHGYRQCEKGQSLQAALASVHAMYRAVKDGD
jgi:hypothetical protein